MISKQSKIMMILALLILPLFMLAQGGITYPGIIIQLGGSPIASNGGGYNITSADSSVNIANPSPGEINITTPFVYLPPQVLESGDIPRVPSGGSNYQATSGFIRQVSWMVEGSNGASAAPVGVGANTTLNTISNAATNVSPTALQGFGIKYAGAATASTSATAAVIYTQTAAGTGRFSLGSTYRYAVKLQLNNLTSQRYWIVLADTISGTTSFSTDTPNQIYTGWRFSATTDTDWMACTGTSSANQDCEDTGISPDTTTPHLFELAYHTTGVDFYMDGQYLVTVGSNVPPNTTLVHMGILGDNKNTNNASQFTFQYMSLTLK